MGQADGQVGMERGQDSNQKNQQAQRASSSSGSGRTRLCLVMRTGEFSQTPEGHGYFGEGMSYEVNFTPKQFLKTGQIYVGGGVSMSSIPIRDDHLKANSVV